MQIIWTVAGEQISRALSFITKNPQFFTILHSSLSSLPCRGLCLHLAGCPDGSLVLNVHRNTGYISYREYKGRPEENNRQNAGGRNQLYRKPSTAGILSFIIMIFSITSVLMLLSPGGWGSPAIVILLLAVFCGVFYIFARMHLFGGADAWRLYSFHLYSDVPVHASAW